MVLYFFKLIFLVLCMYLSQSVATVYPPVEHVLQQFLVQMVQGISLFCLENGMLVDGALISEYHIKSVDNQKETVAMVVQYTEIGRYYFDEGDFEIVQQLHKKPTIKTTQYSFKKTLKGLQITNVDPISCLLNSKK